MNSALGLVVPLLRPRRARDGARRLRLLLGVAAERKREYRDGILEDAEDDVEDGGDGRVVGLGGAAIAGFLCVP